MSIIKKCIKKVTAFESLDEREATDIFQIIMNGGVTPAQAAALLVGLRMKGETVEEITAAAKVMRVKSDDFEAPEGAIDTCGTGGDGSGTFNISTAVAFVVAGCGVPVAKHGNKAISSKSGSADVLQELGVNINAETINMQRALKEANIGFMMATKFHGSMRHIAPIRKEMGVRTIFNMLGPLSNPAGTKFQLMGVYDKKLLEPLAHVLKNLGTETAWLVNGSDGLDEITTTGISYIAELKDGEVRTFELNPEDYGIEIVEAEDLQGGNAMQNSVQLRHLLLGGGNEAYRDIVLINAAACLVVSGKAENIEQGLELARASIEGGNANRALLQLVEISNA